MFKVLSEWCKKQRLAVNVIKNGIMHFPRPRCNLTDFNVVFKSESVQIVDKYKYLGLVLQENLDYKVTSNALAQTGASALGAVFCKYKSNNGFGYEAYILSDIVMELYQFQIMARVWSFGKFDYVNTVQNRAIRLFLGVRKFASNLVINGYMGWLPCIINRDINIIR